MLYRDRRIVSRRKMDRRLRDRAAERREVEEVDHTYFPALSRMFNKDAQAQWRAVIVIVSLTVGALLFGRWVG